MSGPMVSNVVDRSTFPVIDHRARVELVQATLRSVDHGCDAFLYTDLVDLRWLTGFSGSNGWAVVTPDDLIVGTDGRYGERAVAETAGTGASVIAEMSRVRLHEHLVESLAASSAVGLDPSSITQSSWTALESDLALRPIGSIVADLREVKDDAELARIEAAAAAADAALADVEPMLFATVDSRSVRPTSATNSSTACDSTAPTIGATRRSSPPVPTTERAHTTSRPPAGSSRATRSSSTSERWSTDITPT